MKPFKFYDYIIIVSPTGQKASNLREFLNTLEELEDNVLFHHLFQSQLKRKSKAQDYTSDFANWAADSLEDLALAEKLGNFDPYDFSTIAEAKERLIEVIEEHMWDLPSIPWVRSGFEFYFSYATSIIIPSGAEAVNLKEFRDLLKVINKNSFYYHFCESRKIKKEKMHDDFTTWIEENFNKTSLVEKIRDIDFYFYTLDENRKKIMKLINEELQ